MDGILNIYKERGYTSHDVVAKLRGILRQKKIGHTGTLDPDAVGVLPVCCGKATKVCSLLTEQEKSYRAVCRLGVETDTQDMGGKILARGDTRDITREKLEKCLEEFRGGIMQIPPMYSALKVNGKRLYELAREGKTVERRPRPVHIYEISLVEEALDKGLFTMEVTCSKGTYIRTLCHDIGCRLGCLAAMESLVRTRVSVFRIEDAVTLAQLEERMREEPVRAEQMFCTVDSLFPDCSRWQIREEFAGKLANGNPLLPLFLREYIPEHGQGRGEGTGCHGGLDGLPAEADILVYDENGNFKAVYQKGKKDFRVHKMF